jgi:predicted nucleotidyltransferase
MPSKQMINFKQRLNTPLEKIQEFCQHWNIVELAIFGSILREDFDSDSDIDFLVSFVPNAKITFFDLEEMEQQLSELCDRPIDIVTKKAILNSHNWIRRRNILEQAKVIYEQR